MTVEDLVQKPDKSDEMSSTVHNQQEAVGEQNENKNLPRLRRGSFVSWRGNKYPEVKLRGFYSDITSIKNVDKAQVIIEIPEVSQSHAWEVNKEKHLPPGKNYFKITFKSKICYIYSCFNII
jgi:hypothetical protein